MGLFDFLRSRGSRQAHRAVVGLLATKVRDAMTDYVVAISPDKGVLEAGMLMIGEDISTLVVEEQGKPIGMLTERDFVTKVQLKAAPRLKVRGVMTPSVWSIAPDATVAQAVALLRQHRIRKLLVMHPDGTMEGILTQTDISRVLQDKVRTVTSAVPPLFVRDVMREPVVSAPANTSLEDAKHLMAKHAVSALPITEKGDFVGIFTEYDIVMEIAAKDARPVPHVGTIAKSPIKTIPAGLTIFDANTIMLFQNVRRLLVIEDGRPIGIITQTDVVHAAFDYLVKMREYLEREPVLAAKHGFVTLPDKKKIVSEFVGKHLRSYTLKAI